MAVKLLGRPFEIQVLSSMVINEVEQLLPDGKCNRWTEQLFQQLVYMLHVSRQDEWYDGVCNVGYKPTFHQPEDKKLTIEVHILNFSKNIYGEEVVVSWYKHLRSEQKFSGMEALKQQIEKDKQRAIAYFAAQS